MGKSHHELHKSFESQIDRPWYQRGPKPANEKFLRACPCNRCQSERIRRLIAAACVWLNVYRNELRRINGLAPRIPSWQVVSDGGYSVREAEAMWGTM